MEIHRPLAKKDDGRRPRVDFGDEHRSFRQRQVEIFYRDLQIVGGVLFCRVQRQTVDVLDR